MAALLAIVATGSKETHQGWTGEGGAHQGCKDDGAHEPEAPKRGRARSTPVPPRPRAPDPGVKRPENPLPGSLSALRLPLRAPHGPFPKLRGVRRRREPGPAPAVAHNAPGGTASVPSTPFLPTAQATIAGTIDRPPQTPAAVLRDPLGRRSFRHLPAPGL